MTKMVGHFKSGTQFQITKSRLLWVGFFLIVIIGLALAAIFFLRARAKLPPTLSISTGTVALVVLAMLLVYFLSAILWQRYLQIFGIYRLFSDILIDTGFLVVGKYFPGKLVGILGRGVVSEKGVSFNRAGSLISLGEQVSSLGIGIITAGWVAALVYISSVVSVVIITICYFILVCISIRFVLFAIVKMSGKLFVGVTASIYGSLVLGVGYALTWLLTGLSIVPLFGNELMAENIGILLAAFLLSVIAGWLAFIAPAGIGVREAVFAGLAGSVIPWEHALAWVLMHRLICCVIDVMFGATCVVLTTYRYGTK